MLNKFSVILLLIAFQISWSCFGQSEMDKQLALNYYGEGKYDKAILYYEKIYKEDQSASIFEPYFDCLLKTEDFKTAEKICKKQIKNAPNELHFIVLQGKIYETQNDINQANKFYKSAIESISKTTPHKEINKLATAFEKENKLDYTLETYIKANQFAATKSMYNRNIALIYGKQGKTELMINSLLDIIEEDPRFMVSVQSSLSSSIDFQEDPKKVEILKTQLIKRSQSNPKNTIYNEVLAWVYMMTENYSGAFIQLKAIDKKERNDGARIQDLGITCINNEKYDDAIACFDYVIELGPNQPYYREAKIYKLSALKKKIIGGGKYTKEELLSLKNNYEQSLNNLGKTPYSIELIRELAHLEGYFLNNPSRAIELLEETKKISGLPQKIRAEIKVETGDFMVINNQIWDASLLFMQVEKEYKEDKIGHLAKFKAAQVFYYAGDFEFAQGQLDVLKASTSKLIANDAMELSMLITDNYNMDTTQLTMKLYAEAELLIKQHQFDKAISKFDSINEMFKFHSLNDEILWQKSKIALTQQNIPEAIKFLEEIEMNYGTDLLGDNAVFKLAEIYDKILNDKVRAKEYYKKIMFDYQGSLFGVEARKRFREIGGSSSEEITPIVQP